jgi:hypothetical protein
MLVTVNYPKEGERRGWTHRYRFMRLRTYWQSVWTTDRVCVYRIYLSKLWIAVRTYTSPCVLYLVACLGRWVTSARLHFAQFITCSLTFVFRGLTQLVEFLPYTQAVIGSSPVPPTRILFPYSSMWQKYNNFLSLFKENLLTEINKRTIINT